jgi:hypothetical protein
VAAAGGCSSTGGGSNGGGNVLIRPRFVAAPAKDPWTTEGKLVLDQQALQRWQVSYRALLASPGLALLLILYSSVNPQPLEMLFDWPITGAHSTHARHQLIGFSDPSTCNFILSFHKHRPMGFQHLGHQSPFKL